MSRKLIDKARRRLEAESGCRANPWGGRLAVALVYPNTYHQAMSNLGFLSVYHLLNSREDTLCERFFLPDPEDLAEHRKTGYPLFSLESGRFLGRFRPDRLLRLLRERLPEPADPLRAGAPPPVRRRPGGALSPGAVRRGLRLSQPRAAGGDHGPLRHRRGRTSCPPLVEILQWGRGEIPRELLPRLAALPGIYVPSLYRVEYGEDGTLRSCLPREGAPAAGVPPVRFGDLDSAPSRSFVLTEETEFADMALTEISRGCSRGCRFCAAGFLYLPPRERSLENLQRPGGEGLCQPATRSVWWGPRYPTIRRWRSSATTILDRRRRALGGQPAHRFFDRRGSRGAVAHRATAPSPWPPRPAASACAT